MNECSSDKVIFVATSVERSHVNKRSHLVWEIGLHFQSVTVIYRSCDAYETTWSTKIHLAWIWPIQGFSIQSGYAVGSTFP